MKKILLLLSMCSLFSQPVLANVGCFLVMENGKVIQQSGNCKTRHTPCSTFKIALSLMGYEEGFLEDELHPKLPFKKGYIDSVESWNTAQTPMSWIKNSCVWYSQIITQKLGMEKFSSYVKKFDYGNLDVAGDAWKNNGLTRAWLGSSLQISPQEQVQFLQKMLEGKLPVSAKSLAMTKNILFIEELLGGWKFFGKTGSCDIDKNRQTGWFVGWAEKEKRQIIFANYLEVEEKLDYSGGKKAKEQMREKLLTLITDENN